jgi:hypothetical protein
MYYRTVQQVVVSSYNDIPHCWPRRDFNKTLQMKPRFIKKYREIYQKMLDDITPYAMARWLFAAANSSFDSKSCVAAGMASRYIYFGISPLTCLPRIRFIQGRSCIRSWRRRPRATHNRKRRIPTVHPPTSWVQVLVFSDKINSDCSNMHILWLLEHSYALARRSLVFRLHVLCSHGWANCRYDEVSPPPIHTWETKVLTKGTRTPASRKIFRWRPEQWEKNGAFFNLLNIGMMRCTAVELEKGTRLTDYLNCSTCYCE